MGEDVEALAAVPEQLTAAAEALFGERLPVAERYAQMLVGDGVIRGLIGPREAPRIWERHLLNCAAVAELIPSGSTVTDVGSGAGLPGIVLAVARADLRVTLVEPLARRTAFLLEALDVLGLDHATVVRGRAEECAVRLAAAPIVTARAVAPLDRLAAWCLPLTQVGGRLLAFKGAGAAAELTEHAAELDRLGAGPGVVHTCGGAVLPDPTTVVEIVRAREIRSVRAGRGRRGRATR